MAGLAAPVQVIRDRVGVPQIKARHEHGLFFAQGYVHAQDRLWQMEFNRRISAGTLSAVLGSGTPDIDRFMRTLGQCGIGILEDLFNSKAIPARGDSFTVDAAWLSLEDEPFRMTGGASERYIADLSNLENSLTVITTGQSGQLFHPHRTDQISPWQNIQYHAMIFSREAAEANAEGVVTLSP